MLASDFDRYIGRLFIDHLYTSDKKTAHAFLVHVDVSPGLASTVRLWFWGAHIESCCRPYFYFRTDAVTRWELVPE